MIYYLGAGVKRLLTVLFQFFSELCRGYPLSSMRNEFKLRKPLIIFASDKTVFRCRGGRYAEKLIGDIQPHLDQFPSL